VLETQLKDRRVMRNIGWTIVPAELSRYHYKVRSLGKEIKLVKKEDKS